MDKQNILFSLPLQKKFQSKFDTWELKFIYDVLVTDFENFKSSQVHLARKSGNI